MNRKQSNEGFLSRMGEDQGEGGLMPASSGSDPFLDYYATRSKNHDVFLLNFGDDVRAFEALLGLLLRIWTRIGRERDKAGQSHAGLLLFANLLQRHP